MPVVTTLYPTVKSSKWGKPKPPKLEHVWTDKVWKKLCILALLSVEDIDIRWQISLASSFRYTRKEIQIPANYTPTTSSDFD